MTDMDKRTRVAMRKLLAASDEAKNILRPVLDEPGRTAFWVLVAANRDAHKFLGADVALSLPARAVVERRAINGFMGACGNMHFVCNDGAIVWLGDSGTWHELPPIPQPAAPTPAADPTMIPADRQDVQNLDAVIAALGIEDSTITPAEAVAELHAEMERLRAQVAAADPVRKALVEALKNVLKDHEYWNGVSGQTIRECRTALALAGAKP